jgi:hypothetical protein
VLSVQLGFKPLQQTGHSTGGSSSVGAVPA